MKLSYKEALVKAIQLIKVLDIDAFTMSTILAHFFNMPKEDTMNDILTEQNNLETYK